MASGREIKQIAQACLHDFRPPVFDKPVLFSSKQRILGIANSSLKPPPVR